MSACIALNGLTTSIQPSGLMIFFCPSRRYQRHVEPPIHGLRSPGVTGNAACSTPDPQTPFGTLCMPHSVFSSSRVKHRAVHSSPYTFNSFSHRYSLLGIGKGHPRSCHPALGVCTSGESLNGRDALRGARGLPIAGHAPGWEHNIISVQPIGLQLDQGVRQGSSHHVKANSIHAAAGGVMPCSAHPGQYPN